jgi:hypothetical protein
MTPEQARDVLLSATWEDRGTFTLLRLGRDPGPGRTAELRLALRVLWRHWKVCDALPFDLCGAAAMILHFQGECSRNLSSGGVPVRDGLSGRELPDLAQGAFELLCGADAEGSAVRRPDLGE